MVVVKIINISTIITIIIILITITINYYHHFFLLITITFGTTITAQWQTIQKTSIYENKLPRPSWVNTAMVTRVKPRFPLSMNNSWAAALETFRNVPELLSFVVHRGWRVFLKFMYNNVNALMYIVYGGREMCIYAVCVCSVRVLVFVEKNNRLEWLNPCLD